MEGATPPAPSRKIVIGLEDLQEPVTPPTTTMPAATVPAAEAPAPAPLPPVAGIAPAQVPAVPRQSQGTGQGYSGPPRRPAPSAGDVLLVSFAALWKLATAALIVLAIGGYLWGGSNAAHERCLEHRIVADNSLINTFACTVQH
jgi:hypothetical protein